MTAWPAQAPPPAAASLAAAVAKRVAAGERFAGLFGSAGETPWPGAPRDSVPAGVLLSVHLVNGGAVDTLDALLPAGETAYPAVTGQVGAAFWYERELHDMFGVVPGGHPRLEPLILPAGNGMARPRPGAPEVPGQLEPDEHVLARHVAGQGIFTIPHGPVRSGVFESIEYLVETPGEDIPHLNIRVFYKHRGVEKRFEGLDAASGVRLAERAEASRRSRTRWPTVTRSGRSRAVCRRGRPSWPGPARRA